MCGGVDTLGTDGRCRVRWVHPMAHGSRSQRRRGDGARGARSSADVDAGCGLPRDVYPLFFPELGGTATAARAVCLPDVLARRGPCWPRVSNALACDPNGQARAGFRRRLTGNGLWRSLVSALDWGSRGREFKSRQPDHFIAGPSTSSRAAARPTRVVPWRSRMRLHVLGLQDMPLSDEELADLRSALPGVQVG